MKRLSIFLIIIFIISLTGCMSQLVRYNPGKYTNSAEGYYSTLLVEVTVNELQIESIEIISHEEPEILADIVFEKLPPRIIKANGTDVDVISGATYTSKALIDAVDKALEEAVEGLE